MHARRKDRRAGDAYRYVDFLPYRRQLPTSFPSLQTRLIVFDSCSAGGDYPNCPWPHEIGLEDSLAGEE
jgi:hypothetical protein